MKKSENLKKVWEKPEVYTLKIKENTLGGTGQSAEGAGTDPNKKPNPGQVS